LLLSQHVKFVNGLTVLYAPCAFCVSISTRIPKF